MKHCAVTILFFFSALAVTAQVPTATHIQILKAEDARRYDKTLEDLLKSPNADIRERAALAAGRIGREEAIPLLAELLANDPSVRVRVMAAFALGEIESIKAADSILKTLETRQTHDSVRARTVEAAGKIAAANPKDERSKELGAAILKAVDFENAKRPAPSTEIIRLGMTAFLRAKPPGGEDVARKFLRYSDPNVVADALNTLARLRAKNANGEARELLKTHADPIVRANAARVLGAAEDKDALDILLNAATTDKDSRVRVSAIRTLGNLKEAKAADKLIDRWQELFTALQKSRKPRSEKNELLEIATVLGRLLAAKPVAWYFELHEFRDFDRYRSPETEISMARIFPAWYLNGFRFSSPETGKNPPIQAKIEDSADRLVRLYSSTLRSFAEGLAILADVQNVENSPADLPFARKILSGLLDKSLDREWFRSDHFSSADARDEAFANLQMATPNILDAYAKHKPADLEKYLARFLQSDDVFIRAASAGLLAEQPKSKESVDALRAAFTKALSTDLAENDARLAILDALYKLDKKESVGTLLNALNATDYLVRKKAFELLSDKDLQKDVPGIVTALENARRSRKDQVLPYEPKSGTKLGQVLNTDADYRRALARKNGSVKAVLRSEKGTFTINFYPEEAPLTVDNFIKLARSRYFDGLEVHRVVPNFVMQDGDPRGDGNGGPGWSIRCEVNMLPYERGAVGMALSGKDTGGSQWFVTHSPQPHLDGGYTVFGRVNETDMKVVDQIVRGDKILSVKIVGR